MSISIDPIVRLFSRIYDFGHLIFVQLDEQYGRTAAKTIFTVGITLMLLVGSTIAYVPGQDADRDGAANYSEWMPDHQTDWRNADSDDEGGDGGDGQMSFEDMD